MLELYGTGGSRVPTLDIEIWGWKDRWTLPYVQKLNTGIEKILDWSDRWRSLSIAYLDQGHLTSLSGKLSRAGGIPGLKTFTFRALSSD
ncbi:hypothetical protein JVU11DRAFT_7535 [Chiua virens]|nr:hypothetical protein JVU11DRAFT_7535 [Chiua virens]